MPASQEANTPKPARLIINADDFGMSPGVNQGIIHLFEQGRLTSASLLVNTPWSEAAIDYARQQSQHQIGMHLNLTTHKPVLPAEKVQTLVKTGGEFYSLSAFLLRLLTGRINLQEVEAELSAQIQICLDQGIRLAHVDTHMHLHAFPAVGDLVCQLASRYGIEVMRNPDPLAFVVPPFGEPHPIEEAIRTPLSQVAQSTIRFLGGKGLSGQFKSAERVIYLRWCVEQNSDSLNRFRQCLSQLEGLTAEVVAHPAVPDEVLSGLSNYVNGRQRELAFLTGDAFSQLLDEGLVTLV